MDKITIGAALAAFSLLATTACAQSTNDLLRAAINEQGRSCATVTSTNPIATTSAGTTLVAVACADGGRHVVEILADLSLNYVSTCSTFEGVSGVKCF